MSNEEQFDKILDEALKLRESGKSVGDILVLFPEHASELTALLSTADELEKISPDDEAKVAFARMLECLPEKKPDSGNNFFTSILAYMKFLSTVRIAGVALIVVAAIGLTANLRQSAPLLEPTIQTVYFGGSSESAVPPTFVARGMDSANKTIKAKDAAEVGQTTGLSAPSRAVMDEDKSYTGYAPNQPDIMPVPPEPGYPGTPPITDNREFLKTDYNSTIKTRDVAETGNRLQTLVRGYGGRIDGASFNEKFGYLSFVVPQNQFNVFKAELTSMIGKRFIVESVSLQNMLPQKQGIEQQTDQTTQDLSKLKSDRDALTKKHVATLASLNQQLNFVIAELKKLETAVPIDFVSPADEAARNLRIANYKNQISLLRKNIASENYSYQQALDGYNYQIQNAQDNLDNLAKQDKNLIDTVATVQGTIAIEWVSIMEMVNLYTFEGWPWIALAVGGVLVIVSYRRRHPPVAVAV